MTALEIMEAACATAEGGTFRLGSHRGATLLFKQLDIMAGVVLPQ